MRKLVIYIHGKGGTAAEGAHYGPLFPDSDVLGFDYEAETPWDAQTEFRAFYDRWSRDYDRVTLIANSIGAYFALVSLADRDIDHALLISPIVDMERLILDMMGWTGVTEAALCEKGEIPTPFGETLSWRYLCWARDNPVRWRVPAAILYGANDNMTSRDTIERFAAETGAALTVMPAGEHWFHTDEQMAFLDEWVRRSEEARRDERICETEG